MPSLSSQVKQRLGLEDEEPQIYANFESPVSVARFPGLEEPTALSLPLRNPIVGAANDSVRTMSVPYKSPIVSPPRTLKKVKKESESMRRFGLPPASPGPKDARGGGLEEGRARHGRGRPANFAGDPP